MKSNFVIIGFSVCVIVAVIFNGFFDETYANFVLIASAIATVFFVCFIMGKYPMKKIPKNFFIIFGMPCIYVVMVCTAVGLSQSLTAILEQHRSILGSFLEAPFEVCVVFPMLVRDAVKVNDWHLIKEVNLAKFIVGVPMVFAMLSSLNLVRISFAEWNAKRILRNAEQRVVLQN